MAYIKIQEELENINYDPESDFAAGPVNSKDLFLWNATILGPDDTPYEGGQFNLQILFTQDYPQKPPIVRFLTKTYHPNINENGQINLDILSHGWSHKISVLEILQRIQQLLAFPNLRNPAVYEIAYQFVNDNKKFQNIARDWVRKNN